MLHELCHIEYNRHNRKFHALWNQLRDEWEDLCIKRYTGEGFFSKGHKVGGKKVSSQEKQRRTREPAENTENTTREKAESTNMEQGSGFDSGSGSGSGQRLGGRGSESGTSVREAAAAAAEKRWLEALEACAEELLSEQDKLDMVEVATRNGFTTQAEEDEANDFAIAQALAEMALEEENVSPANSAFITPPEVSSLPEFDMWQCSALVFEAIVEDKRDSRRRGKLGCHKSETKT
ncbi:hypothetical protein PT974_06277 [Cladobotryum mycophilum]|uniref:WLM domain-containing protein n=1 Tax=Cladobotryum mycophilum TaxID=491253 RepID=A0ABR0SM72_9HYPO